MIDKIQEAVMISLRPKWAALIATEKKNVEVRRTFPGMVFLPFKLYLYCTNLNGCPLEEYVQIHAMTGGHIDDFIGKVFGECTCDVIHDIDYSREEGYTFGYHQGADCLKDGEFDNYLKGGPGYGWHLTDLEIYDTPKKLSEFGLTRPPQSWRYITEIDE